MRVEMTVSLDHTLGCGQAHRWTKDNERWIGVLGDDVVTMTQEDDGFTFSGVDRRSIERYFRADDDLDLIYREISKDPFIEGLVKEYNGLRLLRQEHWECTATYLLATNANVKRIGQMVGSVCRMFGKDLGGHYSFPSPKEILDGCEKIAECRLGYRDVRLVELAEKVENGKLDLNGIEELDYDGCVSALKEVDGIGDKVADCIALFSYDHLEAIPIDARIKRKLNEIYGISGSYRNVSATARKRFGRYGGYAQEFLYHCGI